MRPAADVVVLENEHWRVGVVPETGASVAFGQVRVDGEWCDVLRPTPTESLRHHADCSSYVLAPWSNRVRDGLLRFDDREWQLRITDDDGTALHGAVFEYPWTVLEKSRSRLVLGFDSTMFVGVNFPWRFRAQVTYVLDGERLRLRTALEDTMAVDAAGPIPERADFVDLRPLGHAFVDDCLTGRTGDVAAYISYPGVLDVAIEADDLFSHVVVYVPVEKPFFAVEPVTNANDAFALDASGVPGVGVFRVQPGETREAAFALFATLAS